MPSPKTATEIDIHVGYRLKRLRREKLFSKFKNMNAGKTAYP